MCERMFPQVVLEHGPDACTLEERMRRPAHLPKQRKKREKTEVQP
jgi:hypothetical protein